ncbi:HD domain-containing protein [Nocardiopsis sp. RSe5-2]|uniref:HD domain-containing protein n=1 Tax=Nocardiopsis endophytica TaxID=3018445 RepID=A0ABT4TXV0_9ACTN|nr:HD domain-containing protein [Nocardiopsis endophytica]MDA2809515.1 HD domain-containing protein [Nocardiopsis endophytica]
MSESGLPLAVHMIEAMDAADALWDGHLSPAFREGLAAGIGEGRARALYRWLSALSGLGRCTPGYQALQAVRFSGDAAAAPVPVAPRTGRHDRASSLLTALFLREEGWSREAAEWAGYAVGGHRVDVLRESADSEETGGEEWRAAQRDLFHGMTGAAGFPLESLAGHVPPPGVQLALSGAVILADRVAAQGGELPVAAPPALADLSAPSGGGGDPQVHGAAVEAAFEMEAPGLLLIGSPEDTEAAFAAAEVLAAKFGLDGFFYALPTQEALDAAAERVLGERRRSLNGMGTLEQLRLDQADTTDPRMMLRQLTLVTRAVIIDAAETAPVPAPRRARRLPRAVPPALAWLGEHGVPAVLLTPDLDEAERSALFESYTGDLLVRPRPGASPRITWATAPQRASRAA